MSDRLVLRVGGRDFEGWQSVSVTRSIENCTSTWSVSASRRVADKVNPIGVRPSSSCEILIRDEEGRAERVLTGFVDDVTASYDARSSSLGLSGRSRTGDLVDCSVISEAKRWSNATPWRIASEIAGSYGIAVVEALPEGEVLDKVPRFRIEPGESCFEALDRLGKAARVLVTDDASGRLVLTRAGNTVASTALVLGEGGNILSGSAVFSAADRYNEYIIRGQRAGDDQDYGAAVASVEGSATDEGDLDAGRHRVLIIRPEVSVSGAAAKLMAEWEAAKRAAESTTLTYTVQGWRQGDGSLWTPNQLVHVRDGEFGIDRQLLVVDVTYTLDADQGTLTTMTLRPREGYLPAPPRAPSKGTGAWAELDAAAKDAEKRRRDKAQGGKR